MFYNESMGLIAAQKVSKKKISSDELFNSIINSYANNKRKTDIYVEEDFFLDKSESKKENKLINEDEWFETAEKAFELAKEDWMKNAEIAFAMAREDWMEEAEEAFQMAKEDFIEIGEEILKKARKDWERENRKGRKQ